MTISTINLKKSIKNADHIDIIVSFLMKSGVNLILDDLKKSNAEIRILTTDYLKITQPEALYILKGEVPNLKLNFFSQSKSFHPKAYIFHNENDSEIYIGSSNLSKGALTTSIEWNYHFKKSENKKDFDYFQNSFNELFLNHSIEVTDDILKNYSKTYINPKFINEKHDQIFEPNSAQVEALYSLNQSREEGFDKALVVAATVLGKTYLAAFDSKNYERILFVAHREF